MTGGSEPSADVQIPVDMVSHLLDAAQALQAGGRPESAKLLVDRLSAQRYSLPLLRRLRAQWRQFTQSAVPERDRFAAKDWTGFGAHNSQKLRCLTILDEISELNWSADFDCTRLVRLSAQQQITEADYDFVLVETAWLGPENDWIYAFTSPGQKHENAQAVLAVLERLRVQIDKPIVIVNKEDPLHFELFFPLVRYADHIITTDQDMVPNYRGRADALSVTALPFAANMSLTNPVGRVNEPQDKVCFAGSFYSGGYDDRARQMDYILQPIIDFRGVIFDRQSRKPNPVHDFPDRFKPYIRPAVGFREMARHYRRFRAFLNVNTIVSSPTMMSRRVYELLASGTPVVSAPSRALEQQFLGIVQIASNAKEAYMQVARLLDDEQHWWKTSQRGIREVTLKHQYAHRAAVIRSIVFGADIEAESPLVSIIIAADRAVHLARIAENISQQSYPRIETVVALGRSWSEDEIASLENMLNTVPTIERVVIQKASDLVPLGQRLHLAVAEAKGDFVALFSDKDHYLPNYLVDMILTFDFSQSVIAGKATYAAWQHAGCRVALYNPGFEHSHVDNFCASTIVARRSWLKKVPFADQSDAPEIDLLKHALSAGDRIYSADHFNFVEVGGLNSMRYPRHGKRRPAEPISVAAACREFEQWKV